MSIKGCYFIGVRNIYNLHLVSFSLSSFKSIMYVKIDKQMPEIIHASVQTGLPDPQYCSPRYQIPNKGAKHIYIVSFRMK